MYENGQSTVVENAYTPNTWEKYTIDMNFVTDRWSVAVNDVTVASDLVFEGGDLDKVQYVLLTAWDHDTGEERVDGRGGFDNLTISTTASSPAPISIGTGKQLFLDDYVVGEMNGLQKVQHQLTRSSANHVMVGDKQWEGIGVEHPLVIRDSATGQYKMYYWGREGGYTTSPINTCYATSQDGINWTNRISVSTKARTARRITT